MDPYLPPVWGVPGNEYDPNYGDLVAPPPSDDQLMVKAAPNQPARPLHTYMAPLSLNGGGNVNVQQQQIRPPSPPPSKRIDMKLAQPGTEESKPGYLTPLASYTAQTFWYFWYADMFSPPATAPAQRMGEDILSSASRPFDSEGRPRLPILPALHPNQLQPNLPFCQFVFSVLHSTQVSFSVTILALMYTYKYKKIMAMGQRPPFYREVSEAQGFVTGLMLANKYLDDNTYTNTTWAQFLGMPVKDVNDYELEWLDALQFNLCVTTGEFDTWRSMLDAHVRSREQGDAAPGSASGYVFPQSGRARSASPPIGFYSPPGSAANQALKRTAKDAFSTDVLHNTGMYEAARFGARKASIAPIGVPSTTLPTPAPSVVSPNTDPNSALARSSSLNRQIARLPVNGRYSAGHEQMGPEVADLRQTAHVNSWSYPGANGEPLDFAKDERWRMPVQPRLYFLQAAATPQFGPDPRYHKAIPHYLDAGYGSAFDYNGNPYGAPDVMDMDPNQQVDLASPSDPMFLQQQAMMAQAPPQQTQPLRPFGVPGSIPQNHFGNPQPAPFANAGPPGYAYGWQTGPQPEPVWVRQHAWRAGHASRWSAGSDDAFMNVRPAPVCHTAAASMWSTPVHATF